MLTNVTVTAPGVAALALSGDWAAEFLSGADSASSASGMAVLGDASDADWTREFIAEAAGSLIFISLLIIFHISISIFRSILCVSFYPPKLHFFHVIPTWECVHMTTCMASAGGPVLSGRYTLDLGTSVLKIVALISW